MSRNNYLIVLMAFVITRVIAKEGAPLKVIRRPNHDTIFYHSGQEDCQQNSTFLVDERRCISDQELLNGCRYAFTHEETQAIAVYIINTYRNETYYSITTSDANSSSDMLATLSFTGPNRETGHTSFDCQIVSLEVYRGMQKPIKINHVGFNITESGAVEIDKDELTYDIDEFYGELFRMNLSCSDQGSGCLFFKVVGETNTATAKFNGTVFPVIPSQPIRMTNEEATTTMVSQRASLDTTLDIITYALIGLSGFLSLLLIVAICCTTLVWCVQCTKKKRRQGNKMATTTCRIPRSLRGELDVSQIISDTRPKERKKIVSPGYYKTQTDSDPAYV